MGYISVKILVFFLFSYALFSCSIAHSEGFYLSGQVGPSILQDADNEANSIILTTSHDVGFNVSGALGYQWNKYLRGELELSYQRNGVKTLTVTQSSFPSLNGLAVKTDGDVRLFNVMLNGFWDFPSNSPVVPYLMGGVGVSSVALEDVTTGSILFADDSTGVTAYQLGAGLDYDFSERIDLTLGYRLLGTSDPEFEDSTGVKFDSEILSHNIAFGVRFYFSPKSKTTSSSISASAKRSLENSKISNGNEEIKSARNAVSDAQGVKNDPRLLLIKKECGLVTNNPHSPPYTKEFLNCMKERGWAQKK